MVPTGSGAINVTGMTGPEQEEDATASGGL